MPSINPMDFFSVKSAASYFKHAVLTNYLAPFTMMVSANQPDQRVVVVDGYAGPGLYEDGSTGSALLLSELCSAVEHRNVDLVLIESDKEIFKKLETNLAIAGYSSTTTRIMGRFEQEIPNVLKTVQTSPAFYFIDPFGIGVSFQNLSRLLTHSGKSEVLLNFSATAVSRIGGYLTSQEARSYYPEVLASVDEQCGGDWWRSIYLQPPPGRDRVDAIVEEFTERLRSSGKHFVVSIPVKKKIGDNTALYHLVFATSNIIGLWKFTQAVSTAQEKLRKEYRKAAMAGTLFEGSPDHEIDEEDSLARHWVKQISNNVLALRTNYGVKVDLKDGKWVDCFGDTLGHAREKHLRASLRDLEHQGILISNSKGNLNTKVLVFRD